MSQQQILSTRSSTARLTRLLRDVVYNSGRGYLDIHTWGPSSCVSGHALRRMYSRERCARRQGCWGLYYEQSLGATDTQYKLEVNSTRAPVSTIAARWIRAQMT